MRIYSSMYAYRCFIKGLLLLCLSMNVVAQAKPLTLSLKEAILLAIRENPSVQQQQLDQVASKFSLKVARWAFQPQYSLDAKAEYARDVVSRVGTASRDYSLTPTVSWKSPIGTTMKLESTNPTNGHYNPGLSLSVTQPLMRGFGRAVVEASLNDALDNREISKLELKQTLIDTITQVIGGYLDVVSAEQAITVDKESLRRARETLRQTSLLIRAGKKSRSDLIQPRTTVASGESRLQGDMNALDSARYNLLNAIGLSPQTRVNFKSKNILALVKKYNLPGKQDALSLGLMNNVSYQTEIIQLRSLKRQLILAKDQNRWKLDLNVDGGVGKGSGGGFDSGLNSLHNGANKNFAASLDLSVPIQDLDAQGALVSAKVGLQNGYLGLKQQKWQLETQIINQRNNVTSFLRSLSLDKRTETLTVRAYEVAHKKYTHGLIDSISESVVQQQLTDAQQAVILSNVAYLRELSSYDQTLGRTLETWDIKVRY